MTNEPREFEIAREFEVDATPEQVWEALTSGTGGWLWPMEYEPKEGGRGPHGATITAWDPEHRLTARSDNPDALPPFQTLNQLDHVIEARDGGSRAWVRYVHSGIFVDNWDDYYDGADKHTDFYLHTLRQYLTHFAGRPVAFAMFDGPAASANPEALAAVGRALGLPDDAAEGTKLRVRPRRRDPGSRTRLPQPVLHRPAHRRRHVPLLRPRPMGRACRHRRPRLRAGRRRRAGRVGLARLAGRGLRLTTPPAGQPAGAADRPAGATDGTAAPAGRGR